MSDLMFAFMEPVTTTYTAALLPASYVTGMRRQENNKTFFLMLAGSAITAGQAVKLDTSAAAGGSVIPTAAIIDPVFGIAETAIASGSYGWVTRFPSKSASANVASTVGAGEFLRASATAGRLEVITDSVGNQNAVAVALSDASSNVATVQLLNSVGAIPKRTTITFDGGALLVDGTTYATSWAPGRAIVVTKITATSAIAIVGGTNTLKVLKGTSSGNTMLSAATVDPTTFTAAVATNVALTSTGADLAIPASGTGSAVYCELVCGTMSTDGKGVSIDIEYYETAI